MPATLPARPLFRLLIILALVGYGCGDDGSAPEPQPEVITPGRLEAAPVQVAAPVGATVTPAPAVTLRDTKGRPIAGATVTFTVTEGGGSLERTTSLTAGDGTASPGSWVLGTRPGTNTLEARSPGVAPVTFAVTTAVGPPATLAAAAAGPGRGVVGQRLEPPPGVVVQDVFGNPVAGTVVAFGTGTGGGQVAESSVATDASGVARTVWTLGPAAGTQTLLAVLGTLSVTIAAEATAGPAASLQVLAGADQSAVVGRPVPVPPSVQVRDAFGNAVAGVAVLFTVTEGAGQVTAGSATTDSAGVARVGSWTLGTRVGQNRLTASVAGIVPVAFAALAIPGPAGALAKVSGDEQTAMAGQTVPIPPAVAVSDTFGNPVPNAEVTFTVTSGSLTGAQVLTDAQGIARVGSWRLGLSAGRQTLEARLGALAAIFAATATPGLPAVIQTAAGQDQTAPAGSAVPVRPAVRVRDAGGNNLAGIVVRFAVVSGGGVVSGANVVTGSDGVAAAGGWTLGTIAGPNRLSATVTGIGPVFFNATGVSGPAARVLKAAGDDQRVASGSAVPIAPTVRVTDVHGNPVRNVPVTFTGSAGSQVSGEAQVTGTTGHASVGQWVLAEAAGLNTLEAAVSGVGNVVFTATGVDLLPPPAPYHIELRYLTAVTPPQQQAFEAAVERWEAVIAADLPDQWLTLPADACGDGSPGVNELIDDLVIFVRLEPIDGAGSVLGSAGPCYIRGGGLPVLGRMRFDSADLQALEAGNRLESVILHEMGHVLGIGTIWSSLGLLVGAGTDDPYFSGAQARSQFLLAQGTSPAGVPVENTGGAGTRDAHWRETALQTELMTGWISAAGIANPLSAITIASLADLGYVVDLGQADPFVLGGGSGFAFDSEPGMLLVEERLPPPQIVR